MSTLQQLREGLERTWDSVAEGWNHLRSRASQALTRFQPSYQKGGLETADEQFLQHSARWGLLAAEVQESGDAVRITLEAPGLDADAFDIQVYNGNMAVIRGEKRVRREQKEGRYHVMECAYGQFERAIPLPAEVDESRARARYRNGVLYLTLPKSEAAVARRIQVRGG
jgi:HSP20 family protein